MAGNSPAGAAGATAASSPVPNGVGTPGRRPDTVRPATLRGLNKPKCSKCGNVARSRCPYQSCKSCCAKAQNPCNIHVLKLNSILPSKLPNSKPITDKSAGDASVSGSSVRVSSLRQIPNNLTRFIGAQNSLKSRRPLSRKDAAAINGWRFSKLKEYNERNTEVEAEAFDRYMQNVSLLEGIFALSSPPGDSELQNGEDYSPEMIPGIKSKLKASNQQNESFRAKLSVLVDEGLQDIRKGEHFDETSFTDDKKNLKRQKNLKQSFGPDRIGPVEDLMGKLNKARTEDDLKHCIQMKATLFDRPADFVGTSAGDTIKGQIPSNGNSGDNPASKLVKPSDLFSPSFRMVTLGQDALSVIDQQLLSKRDIVEL